MTRSRRLRARTAARCVLAAVLGLLVLGGTAGPAAAHASLVGTDPPQGAVLATAPQQVRFTFDEPVRLGDEAVHLFDAAGHELPVQARSVDARVVVDLPAALDDGTYVVSWRVVSTDDHPIAGSLSFSVGAPSAQVAGLPPDGNDPTVTVMHGITQAMLYLGLLAAAGLTLFLALFLPEHPGLARIRRRVRGVIGLGTAIAVLGAVLLLPVTALYQQGLPAADLLSAGPWLDLLVRADGLVALLVTAGLGTIVAVLARVGGAAVTGARRLAILGGALIPLAALALVGHTRSYEPVPLVMATDMLHAGTAAVWLGGLLGLTLSLPGMSDQAGAAGGMLARFSTAAAGLLGLLALSGTFLAWRILGSWGALVGTGYGVVLLVKLGLVGLAVALAGWNRYRLLPRVHARDVGDDDRTQHVATRYLQTAVKGEAALLVVVVALTGFLVNQSPEPSAPSAPGHVAGGPPQTLTAATEDVRVVAHVHPQRVGGNTIFVRLREPTGEALEPYATPTVSISSAHVDLGSQPLTKTGRGAYRLRAILPTNGRWELQVGVRLSEFDNPVLTLPMQIPPSP